MRRAKPAPDIFLLAAERLRVAPQDCLVFEDAPAGIEAAHAAACPVVAVATALPGAQLALLPGVRQVISDYRGLNLPALIAAIARD